MQWGFTLGSGSDRQQWIVRVPDGAHPPSVGETIHFSKGLSGAFTVVSRVFMAEMPEEKVDGPLTWGWSFTVE